MRMPISTAERWRRLHLARKLASSLVILIVIVQVYPLAWLFVTSLRPAQEFASGNAFGLPSAITWENYTRAFQSADLLRYIFNSLVVTGISSLLIVLLGMMAAYAIHVPGSRATES